MMMILTDEEIYAVMTPDTVEGDRFLPHAFARAIEAKIIAKIGEPVAWLMHNETHNQAQSLHFAPKTNWHFTWEAVPLYKIQEVKE